MNKAQTVVRRLRLAGLLVILASIGAAQTVTGRLLGTIQDASGAAIPGAPVTITNRDTGISLKIHTDNTGNYLAPSLQSGTYTVKVEVSGFRTAVSPGGPARGNGYSRFVLDWR